MRKRRIDYTDLRRLPIRAVAEALGMQLGRYGSSWRVREPDGRGLTTLEINETWNNWRRWSGKGQPDRGSTIDLVMACRECDFDAAVQFLTSHFPL